MPSNLKKLVRARMAATGEGYQAALRAVRADGIRKAADVAKGRHDEGESNDVDDFPPTGNSP